MSIVETIRGRQTQLVQLDGNAADILARAEALLSVPRRFATVADMAADTHLDEGLLASTLGYYEEGDGGGALYTIVSGITPDGFADHALANNLFAQLVQTDDTFIMEQWGVATGVESSAAMQACATAAYNLNDGGAVPVMIKMACSPNMKDQVIIGGGNAEFINVDFTNAAPIAIDGGNISATVPMFKFQMSRSVLNLGFMYLSKLGAGVWFFNCNRTSAYYPFVNRFIGYGIKVSGGGSGNFNLYNHGGNEWDRTDPEYPLGETSFVYPGLYCDGPDFNVVGGGMGWSKQNIYLSAEAANVWFINVHPFNGNPDYDDPGVVLRDNPVNVYSDAGGKTYFVNCYFDNGYIKDATNKMQIMNCQQLMLTDRIDVVRPYVRVLSAEDASGEKFQMSGTKTSFGYYTPDFDTVDPDYQYITDNSNLFSGTGSYTWVAQQTNYINTSNSATPDMQFTHKGTAPVWLRYITKQAATPADDVIDVYYGAGDVKSTGAFVSDGLSAMGYGANAKAVLVGSAQTARTDAITLNGPSGRIAWPSAAGSASWAAFQLNNSTLGLDDTITITQKGGTNVYEFIPVKLVAAGAVTINYRSAIGTATDAPNLDFTIVRGSGA